MFPFFGLTDLADNDDRNERTDLNAELHHGLGGSRESKRTTDCDLVFLTTRPPIPSNRNRVGTLYIA